VIYSIIWPAALKEKKTNMLRKIVAIVVFLLVIGSDVFAQQVGQTANNRSNKVADGKFWAVNLTLVGFSVYNIESRFYVLDKCDTCQLKGVFGIPVAKPTRPFAYAEIAAIDVPLLLYSYKLKKQNNKLWFILPLSVAAVHAAVGSHNITFRINF